MNYISAEGLSKTYGEKRLFHNLNFGINYGERVGVIGINGCGKSTLLKILAKIEIPDEGRIAQKANLKFGYLGQNPVFEEDKTVFSNVFNANHPLIQLIRKYEEGLEKANKTAAEEEDFHRVVEDMTNLGAWEYEQRTKEIISRLGIGEMMEKEVRYLSGGQRKRVAMARVLMEEPELLILDEPTNHLDLDTIEWLEDLIHKRFATLLIITHDRYFLDKVTNQIVEIDRGEIYSYKGDYAYYLEKKAAREEMKDAEIEKARNLMRKELEWIRRQPKARGTKAKYRVDAFETLKEKAAQQQKDLELKLQVKTTRQGGKVLEVKRIWKSFDKQDLIQDFSYSFKKGEKIGIIGKNGAGKSTLLNILANLIDPDKGDMDWGETTQIGYYTQEDFEPAVDKRIIELVKDIAEVIELADGHKITASQFLQLFMFPPSVQFSYFSNLSGGEKKRLQLLRVLIKNPNFLILDEPTNDLDIGTLNVLEEFLQAFKGTLILVSHDRYFMDRLVDHIFVFEGEGNIKDFPGNYTDYREDIKERAELQKEEVKKEVVQKVAIQTPVEKPVKRKISFKEQREFEQLGTEIEALELEKQQLTEELHQIVSDHEKLIRISKRIEEIGELLDEKELRWLELSELAG
ncbi:MAG: ABC-F family ATP-binding cassette domain-containing protein [Bacteroidia bacterium]